jgi:glutathione S-transferase
MIRGMRILTVPAALALASSAIAQTTSLDLGDRRLEVIDDPVRIVFMSGGPPPGAERVAEAVEKAGRQRGWQVTPQGPGQWKLEREEANKHRAAVALLCDSASCTINYMNSINLLYRDRRQSGAPLRAIHKTYNTWIRDLASALDSAAGGRRNITYGFAPLADVAAVPHVRDGGRKGYQDFLRRPKPRAFAIAENGAWGAAAPAEGTYAATRNFDSVKRAMERCENRGEGTCRLYAVDDRVVWDPARP